jgi:TolA-binding protein
MTDHAGDEASAKKLMDAGLSAYRKGDLKLAVTELLELVARYPHSSVADNAHYNLGMIYERLGLTEKAHNEYEAVVLFYPNSDAAPFARDKLEELAQKADAAAPLFRQAQELYRQGDYRTAMRRYEQLIEDYPHSSLVDNALFGLGTLHRYHGDATKAAEIFRRIRERHPDSDAAQLLARREKKT